jgi:hypothetical protein
MFKWLFVGLDGHFGQDTPSHGMDSIGGHYTVLSFLILEMLVAVSQI